MTIMRVHSVICVRSVVSETCVIVDRVSQYCRARGSHRATISTHLRALNSLSPAISRQEKSPHMICVIAVNRRRNQSGHMARTLAIGSLLALLAFVFWVAYDQWKMIAVDIPLWGWIAILGGIGFSLIVGVGLMALMYYSERHGYDEDHTQEVKRDEL